MINLGDKFIEHLDLILEYHLREQPIPEKLIESTKMCARFLDLPWDAVSRLENTLSRLPVDPESKSAD